MTYIKPPSDKEVHDALDIPVHRQHIGYETRAEVSHKIYVMFNGNITNQKLLSFLDHYFPPPKPEKKNEAN